MRGALESQENGKAVGVDEIPGEALKYGLDEFLAALFSAIIQHGRIPSDWHRYILVPQRKVT